MVGRPDWNYWRYEQIDDITMLPVDYEDRLSDGDIRKDKYELDYKLWCSKSLWTANEAALISFSRDPDKVLGDDSLLSVEDDSHPEHVELCKHINKLTHLIHEAQQQQVLTSPVFLAERFVEWAIRMGVDFPPYVRKQVEEAAERDRHKVNFASGALQHENREDRSVQDLSQDSDPSPIDANPMANGPWAKLADTRKKIILALLLKHVARWDPENAEESKKTLKNYKFNAYARALCDILRELNLDVDLSQRTISDHLRKATDQLQ